ncbi:MAG: DNA primase [Nitrososphaera sp.]|jgi:DNA primase large subunit
MSRRPQLRLGTGDLAKYPFIDEAGSYIRESGFNWEELDRPEISQILPRAVKRIEAAADGEVFRELDRHEVEITSFLISLILVRAIGIDSLMKKYALAEARRAEEFLVSDIKKSDKDLRLALLSKIFEDLFHLKISFEPSLKLFAVSIPAYLGRASHFHEPEWKLVNRPVSKGMVLLDAEDAVRIIRTELIGLIADRIRAMDVSGVSDHVRQVASELRQRFAPRFEYKLSPVVDYPPCIKHAVETLGRGENLSHAARVMLATYMLAIGRGTDEIVQLFQNAPDFNEKITRYQVEHLAGARGSGTKYSVPSCDKLRIEALCFAIPACDGIINPVQFGRRKS